jgi:hypothetical protein
MPLSFYRLLIFTLYLKFKTFYISFIDRQLSIFVIFFVLSKIIIFVSETLPFL